MGGGLPAAAFGGRADVMARLAPAGPVYQAGTLSGNPVATAAGLATLRACTDEVYAARRRGRRRRSARLVARGAGRGGRAAPACSAPGNLFSVFFADGRGARLRRRAGGSRRAASPAFFHAMLDRGRLPAAVAPSRRGSSRPRTTTPALDRIADALPAAARAAAAAAEPTSPSDDGDDAPSSTCCGTARCTTRPACSTAGCPASTSPSSAGEMAERVAEARWPGRDVTYVRVLPAGAGAGDGGADRRRRTACRSPSTSG